MISTSIGASTPHAERVRARRVEHAPVARRIGAAGLIVEALVELAQRRRRQVDGLDRLRGERSRGHPLPRVDGGRLRLPDPRPSEPGRVAIARYSEAIATQSSVSASTAGLQAIGSRSTANPSAVPTAKV